MRLPWFGLLHVINRCQDLIFLKPETAIMPGDDGQIAAVLPGQATLVNSATGAAGALAGWAISSLGKKVCGSLS